MFNNYFSIQWTVQNRQCRTKLPEKKETSKVSPEIPQLLASRHFLNHSAKEGQPTQTTTVSTLTEETAMSESAEPDTRQKGIISHHAPQISWVLYSLWGCCWRWNPNVAKISTMILNNGGNVLVLSLPIMAVKAYSFTIKCWILVWNIFSLPKQVNRSLSYFIRNWCLRENVITETDNIAPVLILRWNSQTPYLSLENLRCACPWHALQPCLSLTLPLTQASLPFSVHRTCQLCPSLRALATTILSA